MDEANFSLPPISSIQPVTTPALDNVTNSSVSVMTGSTAWTLLEKKTFLISQPIHLAISIFNLIFASLGLIANAVVVFIVVRFRDMHTTTNYLFANLAVTDFILLLTHGLLSTLDSAGIYLSHALGCWLPFLVRFASTEASSLTLCMLTYDRWRLIAYPLESLQNTTRRKRHFQISILFVWIVSFVLYIPVALYTFEIESDCSIYFPWIYGQKAFHTYTTVIVYVAPLIFVLILYIKIWKAILKSGINPATSTKGNQSKSSARKRRTLRLIIFTVVTYALAWAPERTLVMLVVWDDNITGISVLFTTGRIASYTCLIVNSAINPFIYSFAGSGFMKHILFWRDTSHNKTQTTNVKSDRQNPNNQGLGISVQNVPAEASVSRGSFSNSKAHPSTIECNLGSILEDGSI